MSRSLAFFVVTLIFVASLCVSAEGLAKETIKLSEKDIGRTVTLKSGDTLEISLAGNPTTGFIWEAKGVNSKVIKKIGGPDFYGDYDLKAVGVGGRIVLRFTAVAAGRTELKLIYRRPWETAAPIKIFKAAVAVE